jgi:lipoprotein Spr
MKLPYITIPCLAVLVLTSCKSLSKLGAKDNSSAKNATLAKRNGQQPVFLDQIEVTPGSVVTTRHKTSTTNSKRSNARNTGAESMPGYGLSSVEIERANGLQLKYAVLMDATVEQLTNIPLLESIEKWWGTKYCLGGATDNCIDCSAFTQVILRDVYKQNLPRTAQEQYNTCEKIQLEDLKEGDLVFFHTTGRNISHVGVYLLNNKFVHAATSGGVMISDLNDKYWQPRYRGAGRLTTD